MATARRTKRSIKDRPKHRQKLSLKTRRRNAKLAASRKRGLNRAKAKRRSSTGRRRKLGR